MKKIINKDVKYHFVEVMSCSGGCIGGGGQPYKTDTDKIKARLESIYKIDIEKKVRKAHENPNVKQIYNEFLEKPLSPVSHKYLHTSYKARKKT